DGTVYSTSYADRKVIAFDSGGGKLWEFLAMNAFSAVSTLIGPDGTIYAGNTDGRLYAIKGTAPLANSPWPMFLHDPQHTGRARSGNLPPNVSLSSPTNGASFISPATIALAANATDGDGTVVRVDFLANGSLLGSDSGAPFDFMWTNP